MAGQLPRVGDMSVWPMKALSARLEERGIAASRCEEEASVSAGALQPKIEETRLTAIIAGVTPLIRVEASAAEFASALVNGDDASCA